MPTHRPQPKIKTCYRTRNGDCHIGGCPEGTYQHPRTLLCTPLPPRSEAIQEVELFNEPTQFSKPVVKELSHTAQPLSTVLPVTGGSDNQAYNLGDLVGIVTLALLLTSIGYLICQLIQTHLTKREEQNETPKDQETYTDSDSKEKSPKIDKVKRERVSPKDAFERADNPETDPKVKKIKVKSEK